MISIVFPHADNPENNKVLDLKLKMFKENTGCEYEILYLPNDMRPELVYNFWDWGMRNAKYDLILWDNTDIVYAKNWQENVLKHKDDGDWIGLELVECGQIGVAPTNIHMDFGRTADTFRREDFEGFARTYGLGRPSMRDGFCWYSPSVWSKEFYIKMGGFDFSKPFPHPNDGEFREKCEAANCKFIVVNSFAYHFQRGHIHQGLQPEHK